MKTPQKLLRLGQISALLHESKMSTLQKAARARQDSLDRLADLEAPHPPNDLPAATAEEVTRLYALWADQQRSQINRALARQTADWHSALQAAALAFGRDQVVQGLAKVPAAPIRRGEEYL